MNYLAHSHLSYQYPYLLVGNFVADMLTNRDLPALPLPYHDGVTLHRHIDDFTDSHPIVRQATALLHSSQGKYAPVVIDILYDHLLTQNWAKLTNEPLTKVVEITYSTLLSHIDELPSRVQSKIRGMIQDNFLAQYATVEGLERSFAYLSRRAQFDNRFAYAIHDLTQHYADLERGFLAFYPLLQASCKPIIDTCQAS